MTSMREFEKEQLNLLRQINQKLGQFLVPNKVLVPNKEATREIITESLIIEIDGMQAPWIIEGLKWVGKNEIDDEEELTDFLGINPNDDDPDGLPWCGAWAGKILGDAAVPTINSLRAVDYINYGEPCECVNGALAIFDAGRIPGGHVGFVIDDTKILGGNQGDSVRKNNLAWYLENKTLLGYRCPVGYRLT